jgi:DNA-binding CsgD family transcriptional regulator
VILGARVASAAGDAGLRVRVLQATEVLERERPAIPLFSGVAQHARGILEGDAQALLAAADVLRSSSRPLLYAAAAEDAGAELARTDHPDKAIHQLNAAFDSYMGHEALADARRVGRALRRLGVHRRIVSQPRAKTGWDSLTDSEVTVVNLIAQGATNRSAAQRLHLSPHTVRAHLRNAFVKLGVSSRIELSKLVRGADHHAD